jgi:HEAT repeat protein
LFIIICQAGRIYANGWEHGAIQDGDAYPTLIEMLTDTVPAVRYFAVKGLHELGRRDAAGPISNLSLQISRRWEHRSNKEMISDPVAVLADLSFQVAALRAISELDAPRGLEALLQAAHPRAIPRNSAATLKIAGGFYRQRRIAFNGLGYTRSRRAAAFLAGPAGLNDPDFRLRAVAVRSLGVLGFSDAAQRVLDSLNDPQAEVRWTAVSVLGRLEDLNAVDPLIEGLTDINAEVRRQAALSLGYLGDRRAYDGLSRMAENDGNEAVRSAAAYSLQLLEK